MARHRWIFANWFSRDRAPSKARITARRKLRRPLFESLEARALLTTLYVDFGLAQPQITAGDLADPMMAAGPNLLKAGNAVNPNNPIGLYDPTTQLTFQSLRNVVTTRQIDFNGDGRVNAADYTALHDSILSIVNRIFEPFNVTVKENSAGNVMDIMSTFDKSGVAYVFAGGVLNGMPNGGGNGGPLTGTVAGDRQAQTANAATGDPGTPIFGDASTIDTVGASNATDETAVVYADALAQFSKSAAFGFPLDVAIANVIAREAGQTFGLLLDKANPTTFADQTLEASSDVMAADAQSAAQGAPLGTPANEHLQNIGMFSRFPLMTDQSVNGMNLGNNNNVSNTQNSYATLLTNVTANKTANFSDVVTGTGAFDQITIKAGAMPGKADVVVTAFNDATFQTQIGPAASNPQKYTVDYSKGLLIDLGRSNDQISIDGTLGVGIRLRGGAGDTELDVNGDGKVDGTFTPNDLTTTVPGLGATLGASIQVPSLKTNITASEFTAASTVFVSKFNKFTYLTAGKASATLQTTGGATNGGVVDISGQLTSTDKNNNLVTTDAAILRFQDVANFLVDTTKGAATNDSLTIGDGGFAAKGLVNFEFDAGPGSDTLTIGYPDISLPDPKGVFTYDAGAGNDTIATDADGDFILTDDLLTSVTGGSVVLLNIKGEVANLTGGVSNNTITVNTWAGTGTLDGGGGDDNLVLGTSGDIDTVVGRFLVKGGDGKDTLTLDDSATSDDVDYIVNPTSVEMDPATPTPFGGVDYDPTVENVVLIGTTGDNNFLVTPSSNTTMRIYGSDPPYGALPPHGDGLKVDFTGTSGRKLITNIAPKGPGNGAWTFTDGHKPVIYVSMEKIQSSLFAATADTGQLSKPLVNIFETSSQSLVASFYAYPQTFRGGVRVTMADVNGDGIADVITSPGVGKVPGVAGDVVKVYDGAKLINMAPLTGQHLIANPDAALISSFKPEGSVYVGGLYLATGDVNGDGTLDLVTSRSTGSSLVRAFLNGGSGAFGGPAFVSFAPYTAKDKITVGGAVVATGDMNGDGIAEIVTAPGPGSQVKIKLFDVSNAAPVLIRQFLGFESTFLRGVSLAVGDLNGDGISEIVVGAGAGGGSRVRVLNSFGGLVKAFTAYTTGNINAAVRLTLRPADDRLLLYTAQSNDGRSHLIKRFDTLTGALVDQFFDNTPDLSSGVFLG